MRLNSRYKKILNYIIGPILFVVLAYSIYYKIIHQPNLHGSWQSMLQTMARNPMLWILMIVLMCLNWSIEARKWQLLIKPVQKVSLFTGFKAVLSGLSFSLFIPNGIGEYLGRMLYLGEGNRLRSVAVSFVGSLSQVLVTLIIGVAGLHYLLIYVPSFSAQTIGLSRFWLKALIYAVYIFIIFFIFLYFKISLFAKWFEKIPFVYKHRVFVNSLEKFDNPLLWHILLLSLIRYIIFIAQYVLMFYLCNVQMPITWAISSVSVLFLLLAIVPTIPIAELGVRGEISIKVFGLLTKNTLGIVSVAAFIWLINIIIPSLIGSLFVLSLRIFKKKELKNNVNSVNQY